MQFEDFVKHNKSVERICDDLNHMRKKIEMRKSEIFKYCEKLKEDDRICMENVSEITKRIDDMIGEEGTEDLDIENSLSLLNGKKETVKEIEDLMQNTEKVIDECCFENRTFCKDNIAVAHSKLEKYKHYLDERISCLSKVRGDHDRFKMAAEKIRKFVELKKKQLHSNGQSKIERQLSEANKCCLEIEHEERELFSPIQGARSLVLKDQIYGLDDLQREADEVASLWTSFENEAKQIQSDLAGKYKEKQELIEELKNLFEMLNIIRKGIKNFRVMDRMSFIECEEEIGDLYAGFERRQDKIKGIFERADGFCSSKLVGEDVEEVSAIAAKTKDMNSEMKFDFQESMHALESIKKRFNMLRKLADDKEMFVTALCDRMDNLKGRRMGGKSMIEDYEKMQLTMNEVEDEAKQIMEDVQSIKDQLPETESDQCDEIISSLRKRLSGLQEIAKSYHLEVKKLDDEEREGVLELGIINEELIKIKRNKLNQRGSDDIEKMAEHLSKKKLHFEEIVERIENFKNVFLASDCLENSTGMNEKMCDVVGLKDAIEMKLSDENSMVQNLMLKKVALENEITRGLNKLEEMEKLVSVTSQDGRIDERAELLKKLKEELQDFESRLSEKLGDGGMAFLPFGNQEEIKRQMIMLVDRANLCRDSIENQLSYLEDRITLKQKNKNDIKQCLDEIQEMENCDYPVNEKELKMMSERLEKIAIQQSSLSMVIGDAENGEVLVLINDAKDRLTALDSRVVATVNIEDKEGRNLDDEFSESEDQIKPQIDVNVESELGMDFTNNDNVDGETIVNVEIGPEIDEKNLECPTTELKANDEFVDVELESHGDRLKQPMQESEGEFESLEKLKERVNKHSQTIQKIKDMAIESPNENNLQHCIKSMKYCLENVGFVLNDIPDLSQKLDGHKKQGSVAEVSQLLGDIQNLEEICNLTRNNLIAKTERFTYLEANFTKHERKLKEFCVKLETVTNTFVGGVTNTRGSLVSQVEEVEEAIEAAKLVLSEGKKDSLQGLPLEERETLLQIEAELKDKLHEAEQACSYPVSLKTIKDSILKLDSIKSLVSNSAKEVEEIKGSEATPNSIDSLEKIVKTVEEARSEAVIIKANVEKELEKIPADLVEEFNVVSEPIEDSLEKLIVETKQLMNSKQLVVKIEDEIRDLSAVVTKLDERCDKVLREEDLMVVIGALNDSIQEIANVTERVPEMHMAISNASMDLPPEEFATLKGQLDSITSKNVQIQQKLTLNCEKFEEAEKAKGNLNNALQEIKVDVKEFNEKIEDIRKIDDIKEIQDLLKFYEFKLKEMNDDLENKIADFERSSDYLHANVQNQMACEIDNARKAVVENSRKLSEMQKWMKAISDVADNVEEKLNRGMSIESTEFEVSSSEEQTENHVATLKEFINELTICQDRIGYMEMGEEFQELGKSTDICNVVISQVVKGFVEKMKEQIVYAKDETIKKINLEHEKMSLMKIFTAVGVVEISLNEMHSFVERQLQVDDREKEMRTIMEHVRKIEEQEGEIIEHFKRIETVQNLNSEKKKLADMLVDTSKDLSKTKEEMIIRYEKLRDIQKQFTERNECLKEITQQMKAIEEQKLRHTEEDSGGLKMKIVNLEEKQKFVTSLKNKLKECSAQDEELLEDLSTDETCRFQEKIKEAEESMENLESAIGKEVKSIELITDLRQKVDELKELNENMNFLLSELKNKKIPAEPSVLKNFANCVENCNVSVSDESAYLVAQDLLVEFKKEKENAGMIIMEADRVNEELVEGRMKVEYLEMEVKKIYETIDKESLKEGKLALQIEFLESGIEVKRKTVEETEQLIDVVAEISSKIPQQKYNEMKRQILDLNDTCKTEVRIDLDRLKKLNDIKEFLDEFKEVSRDLISMDFDSPDLLDCSLNETENLKEEIDLYKKNLCLTKEKVAEKMKQIEKVNDLLSEEEKAEVFEINEDVAKKAASMERKLENEKNRCDMKQNVLKKLCGMKSEIETILSEIDKKQCSRDNEELSNELEGMKAKLGDMKSELHELKGRLKGDEFCLSEDCMIMADMEFCEMKADEILAKYLLFEKCIQTLDQASESRMREFLIEKDKLDCIIENDNMTLAEKGKLLEDLKGELKRQESTIAELCEELEENRVYVNDEDFDCIMTRIGMEMTATRNKIDALLERISEQDIYKKDLEESSGILNEINNALNRIGDVDVVNVDNGTIDDALGLVNVHRDVLENGTKDVEKIWNKIESFDLKCADVKDLLLNCAKINKRLGQLKASNDEKSMILSRKLSIKDSMERLRLNIEVLQRTDKNFNVKSTDGQEELETAYGIILAVEEQFSELNGCLFEGTLDEDFVNHTKRDIGQLENTFSELKSDIVVKKDMLQKVKEDLRLTEERLEKLYKMVDDISGKESTEHSLEEQLLENKKGTEMLKEMLESFENYEQLAHDILDYIPEPDEKRLKDSLKDCDLKLKDLEKNLETKKDEILRAQKELNMKQCVDEIRDKLEAIEEDEIIGITMENLEFGREKFLGQIEAIEKLENDVNLMNIDDPSESGSRDIREDLKGKKNRVVAGYELIEGKIKLMSALEEEKKGVVDMGKTLEILEICDEDVVNLIGQIKDKATLTKEKVSELEKDLRNLTGRICTDDEVAIADNLGEISSRVDKIKQMLDLIHMGRKAFCESEQVFLGLPHSDHSVSELLENSESEEALDFVVKDLRRDSQLYDTAYQHCKELIHMLNSIFENGVNMVQSKQIADDYLHKIEQGKEEIVGEMKEVEKALEQYHHFRDEAEAAKLDLNDVECHELPPFNNSQIIAAFESLKKSKEELADVEGRVQDIEKKILQSEPHLPISLTKKLLKEVTKLQNEVTVKAQRLNSFEDSTVKMKNVLEDFVNLKAEVDEHSDLLRGESFWNACIEGKENANSRIEACENVLSRLEGLTKAIYSFNDIEGDVDAKDVLKDLENEKEKISGIKGEMKKKSNEMNKINEFLCEMEAAGDSLKGMGTGLFDIILISVWKKLIIFGNDFERFKTA